MGTIWVHGFEISVTYGDGIGNRWGCTVSPKNVEKNDNSSQLCKHECYKKSDFRKRNCTSSSTKYNSFEEKSRVFLNFLVVKLYAVWFSKVLEILSHNFGRCIMPNESPWQIFLISDKWGRFQSFPKLFDSQS